MNNHILEKYLHSLSEIPGAKFIKPLATSKIGNKIGKKLAKTKLYQKVLKNPFMMSHHGKDVVLKLKNKKKYVQALKKTKRRAKPNIQIV